MVPSYYHQAMPSSKKLHNNNKGRCPIQKKTQAHLKPYQCQDKKVEDELVLQNNHMQTVKTVDSKQNANNLGQSRPKRDIKPPIKLDV